MRRETILGICAACVTLAIWNGASGNYKVALGNVIGLLIFLWIAWIVEK